MIDFTRAFRTHKDIAQAKNTEIDGLLARRDKIVKFFEDEVAKKGEGAVLFDIPRVGQPCGVGL